MHRRVERMVHWLSVNNLQYLLFLSPCLLVYVYAHSFLLLTLLKAGYQYHDVVSPTTSFIIPLPRIRVFSFTTPLPHLIKSSLIWLHFSQTSKLSWEISYSFFLTPIPMKFHSRPWLLSVISSPQYRTLFPCLSMISNPLNSPAQPSYRKPQILD